MKKLFTASYLLHVAIVFAAAFLTQFAAGLVNVTSVPTLAAVATSAVAAGISAVVHALFGAQAPAAAYRPVVYDPQTGKVVSKPPSTYEGK